MNITKSLGSDEIEKSSEVEVRRNNRELARVRCGGSWLPSMVVVALGEPGAPVTCCASAGSHDRKAPRATSETLVINCFTHIAASKTDYAAASPIEH